MEFDDDELSFLRNAVDLLNAHLGYGPGATAIDAPVRERGRALLEKLWKYQPKEKDDGRWKVEAERDR
jgi:hypothetical protein